MKFVTLLLSAFCAAILLSSCQKEYDPGITLITGSSSANVKTYTEDVPNQECER